MRNRLYEQLHLVPALQKLHLGNASYGYTPELFRKNFLSGLADMTRLTHFSLHFDCFDELIEVLARNCAATLLVLDMEWSQKVTDACLPHLCLLLRLHQLHMFSCGLSGEGQAQVLRRLPRLVSLPRGDFLCEAVDWLDWSLDQEEEGSRVELGVREFHYSEEYHFHTVAQVEQVARLCPAITHVRFMFGKEELGHYLHLQHFARMTSLQVCGGDFYTDRLEGLLEVVGGRLEELDVYAVGEVDMKALAMLTIYCSGLRSLSLRGCHFQAPEAASGEGRGGREVVEELLQPLPHLAHLRLTTHGSCEYVETLVSKCRSLTHLELGRSVTIQDSTIASILASNTLDHLEHLHISGGGSHPSKVHLLPRVGAP